MDKLEKPPAITVRKIYQVLVRKPSSFVDLLETTDLDETHLTAALNFLKDKGMIVSYNVTTKCEIFRMVRTQPLKYGWNLPWLDHMINESNWKTPWKHVFRKAEINAEDKLNKSFVNLMKDLLLEPNLDLIEVLEELEMTDVPLEVLKFHNQQPYCLECLRNQKKFVRMILCEQSEEHCCPSCGIVRETLLTKRR